MATSKGKKSVEPTRKAAAAKAAPAKKHPAPAKKAVPAKKKSAPAKKKQAVAKKAAPAKKKPAPAKKAAPTEKMAAPAKKVAPAPAKKAPSAPKAAPAPKATPTAKAVPARAVPAKAAPAKPAAAQGAPAPKEPPAKKLPPKKPEPKVHRPKAKMGPDGILILEEDKILHKAFYAGQQMPSPMGGFLQLLVVRAKDDGSAVAHMECSASSLRYLMELSKATKGERSHVKEVQETGGDPDCPRHGAGVRLLRAGKELVCPLCGVTYGRV